MNKSINPILHDIMIKRLLIANRGEIACRIIRTAKKLGICCVAIYSEVDQAAQHVKQADEAYCVGPAPSRESYLNIDKIIQIAQQHQADAIHPGYGFLAENAEFAVRCTETGITFIGPPAEAIELMGNKNQAKRLLANADIPLLPSYYGQTQELSTLQTAANHIGYPLLLKAAAGGGGKGMRIVYHAHEFEEQLAAAKREALASFGCDEILLEKYLVKPRHIEVQIFADVHGNVVHLFDRDCSIQRRYQKIIEEAPAPNIPDEVRQQLHSAAVKIAKTIDYVGAGTIEFIFDEDNRFYFMEMNTRLQVEHPVTEMITGYDLVEWQLNIAAGYPLPVTQQDIQIHGHAIEARICAENPQLDFLPSAGKIHFLRFPPTDSNVRIDCGIVTGDIITSYYDSLLAKLIVHGSDRKQAITRLTQALINCQVAGVQTNLPLLRKITTLPDFEAALLHTQLIPVHQAELLAKSADVEPEAWLAVSLYIILMQIKQILAAAEPSPWLTFDGWRLNTHPYQQTLEIKTDQHQCSIFITYSATGYTCELQGERYQVAGYLENDSQLYLTCNNSTQIFTIIQIEEQYHLLCANQTIVFEQALAQYEQTVAQEHSMHAQLPGTLVAVFVEPGQHVKQGAPLLAIEAMKMEHVIRAPYAGKIETIYHQVGEQVAEGTKLIHLMEDSNATA